jgi:hypothetical protein
MVGWRPRHRDKPPYVEGRDPFARAGEFKPVIFLAIAVAGRPDPSQ